MVIMTLRLSVPAERIADVIAISKTMIEPICVEPECIEIALYSDVTKDNSLVLMEKWASQEALEEHIQSNDFLKILAIIELADRTPVIDFYTVSHSAGFELIEALRG